MKARPLRDPRTRDEQAPRRHSAVPSGRVLVDVVAAMPAGRRHLARLRDRARAYLAALALQDVELSVLLTDDAGIQALNRSWRRKNKPTDVLSFPAGEPPGTTGPRHLGDVILSLDTARRQARTHRRTLAKELDHYLAHGLLHLLGHDHHRRGDARRMAALERRLLGRPGMVPGPRPRRLTPGRHADSRAFW